ncbi:MAG: STAS domain-containing protein [Lachnospiraceae bacterium]|nr:STAS domain-containing protein [Lachnospiraceae bacterium]
MTITEVKEGEELRLVVEGRVDTNTSPELQDRILKSFQKASNLTLDLEKTAYISSAGLRALLLGHKTARSKGGSLAITNVTDAVMEIFEVTGFADILDIRH